MQKVTKCQKCEGEVQFTCGNSVVPRRDTHSIPDGNFIQRVTEIVLLHIKNSICLLVNSNIYSPWVFFNTGKCKIAFLKSGVNRFQKATVQNYMQGQPSIVKNYIRPLLPQMHPFVKGFRSGFPRLDNRIIWHCPKVVSLSLASKLFELSGRC